MVNYYRVHVLRVDPRSDEWDRRLVWATVNMVRLRHTRKTFALIRRELERHYELIDGHRGIVVAIERQKGERSCTV
jgi:hypothetical protein